jgi:CubicO group peptidase (beta-lactamase class C family)
MPSAYLLDALVIATVAMTLLVAAARLVDRWWPSRSGHVRHQVASHSLMAGLAVLVCTAVARPGPVGCLVVSCVLPGDAVGRAEASLHFAMVGAGKASPGETPRIAGPMSDRRSWPGLIVLAWLAGASVIATRSARRRLEAWRLIRESTAVTDPHLVEAVARVAGALGLRGRVRVRRHRQVTAPAVAGVLRPVLFVPAQFSDAAPAAIEMVLLHELAHLERRDGRTALLVELAAALFWFHPMIWGAPRRVRALQEVAADSRVLASGVQPTRYAQYLLDSLRAMGDRPALAAGAQSILGDCLIEARLKSILDPSTCHRAPRRRLSMAISGCFALMAVAMAWLPRSLQAMGVLPQASSAAASGPVQALLNAPAIDSLVRPLVIDRMADRYIAGSAVVVVSGDRIIYQAGFGRREVFQEDPVRVDRTIWRIGSITKVLTGVAVMQLADRGLLRLDADVNQYLTRVKVPATFPQPVTAHHLLTHTAGFDQLGLDRHVATRAAVRPLSAFLAENLVRVRPPGQIATYDTYGITLAGHLVEQLSGMGYEEYLRRNLFEPLEMNRSSIVVPPALADDVAIGYGFAGHWEAEPWEFMNTDPASTVNATAPEMGNFLVMLLNGGRFKGRQVLSEGAVRQMLTPQFTNHPEQPGYGYTFWEDRSFGIPAFSHGGSMTGYGAFLYVIPEHRFGVFIAYNQESSVLGHAVVSKLVTALFPGSGTAPRLRSPYPADADIGRFAGSYASTLHNHRNPDRGWRRRPFDVTVNDSGQVVFEGQSATRVGPLVFQRPDGVLVTFRENARKEITHMFVNQASFERIR